MTPKGDPLVNKIIGETVGKIGPTAADMDKALRKIAHPRRIKPLGGSSSFHASKPSKPTPVQSGHWSGH